MSDTAESSEHWLTEVVDNILEAIPDPEPTPPERVNAREFTAQNARNHIVIYHGDERVARIQPEHGEQLAAELSAALRERRGEDLD